MKNSYVVIMAGGIGSRYWPMSKASKPKQFIDILGVGKSLLQQTFDRFNKIIPTENIYIVTNESYRKLVQEQLPSLHNNNILGEPSGKNTAPCIAYACYKIHTQDPEANVVVAPSDHLIMDNEMFFAAIETAFNTSIKHKSLVTIGIQPNRPDTGYGYIQYIDSETDDAIKKVKTFTEKPELALAKTFIASGDFLWNAGIFIFKTSTIKAAFEKFLPEMHNLFKDGHKFFYTDKEQEFIENVYSQCTNISIDYGIMEKANNVYVVPGDFGWSDLGTWNSLYDILPKDEQGNAIVGKLTRAYESEGNIVNVPDNKLVVIKGVKDLIIVENDQILLICDKNREQEVKEIVTDIKLAYGDKYN
jgi:mannose-1-phosphate guanylyltransferase